MADSTNLGMVFGVAELLDRCMGEAELAIEILGIFETEGPQHVKFIGEFLAAGKLDEASRRGHALKGMAANVAARALALAAAEVEHGGRAGDAARAAAGHAVVVKAIESAMAALPGVVAELGRAQAA